MNVTDIINAAMQGSESDIAVSVPDNTPAYTTEIEKLAAALDFIGANLEDSEPTFEEKLAEYAMIEEWLEKEAGRRGKKKKSAKSVGRNLDDPSARKKADARRAAEEAERKAQVEEEGRARAERNRQAQEESLNRRVQEITEKSKAAQARADAQAAGSAPAPETVTPSTPDPEPVTPSTAEEAEPKKAKKSFMKMLGEQTGFSDVAGRSATNRNLRRAGTVGAGLGLLGGGYHLATKKKSDQKKTASLYEAAQFGKAQLLEKVGTLTDTDEGRREQRRRQEAQAEANRRMQMQIAGITEDELQDLEEINPSPRPRTTSETSSDTSKKAKKSFMKMLGEQTGFSDVAGRSATNRNLRRAGTVGTGLAALGGGYHLATRKKKDQKKTASLIEKVAEDRINPAKINAGPADAYSGMTLSVPASEHDIVRAKAQKVRNRINAEMQQYVNNTGKGYNLDGHLNVFNK